MMKKLLFTLCSLLLLVHLAAAQTAVLYGSVRAESGPLEFASVGIPGSPWGTYTDADGRYRIEGIPAGSYQLQVSLVGYEGVQRSIRLQAGQQLQLDVELQPSAREALQEVVVTGTLREVNRLDSPVPVEVYNPSFFRKNPTPTVFEALQQVNGVRPQLNCNVCNTGDIHINGLEGPYTMVLLDGMPIVSSLASVYGLSGIPNALIERVEVVKGPAASLYGSEAIGGLINIITKDPQQAPLLSADVFTSSWLEHSADLGLKLQAGQKATVLNGLSYYHYRTPLDKNADGFTDVTLQQRISLFQKWHFRRRSDRLFSLAGRYLYEDRWGGDMRWTPAYRGGGSLYGESIYTSRWELIGAYQLPLPEQVLLRFSYNQHRQNSVYGTVPFLARQNIAFAQLSWDKPLGRHTLLTGLALRHTFYDDNTPATASPDAARPLNQPDNTWLPGLFVQQEWQLHPRHQLLTGLRYDYHARHGSIYTPRLAYKWKAGEDRLLRLNAGTGFRVVNLFTEDHAALTGAREIEVPTSLAPERSINTNLNYTHRLLTTSSLFLSLEATAFYTYFSNRILPDYETDPGKIIYSNLQGHGLSRGLSLDIDADFKSGLKLLAGATLLDVVTVEGGRRQRQLLTERFSGNWAVSYPLRRLQLSLDYTGTLYSPMRLPLLGPLDPRPATSPWWSLQNIQLTYKGLRRLEVYGGIKNLLNWTPSRGTPFLIARAHDPFDKQVQFDAAGQPQATSENPYALTFDPTYMWAPNQGMRAFLGIRLTVDK
ncbi:TonB-dependent receptor [Cesiribacter andamanensis]|uniref:Colicin I receptor n=1 Tax=Cesiribacter andamanensis AMV16 TaxID=1279009 RepID=M7N5F7_9BACT|nr:Colicin I receptor precursor [Cesiribacter andamanensis AMV16]